MEKNTHFSALHSIKSIASLFLLIAILCSVSSFGQTFPAGFSQVKVATIYYPTSMVKCSDGRIFVTEKSGKVKIIKNGAVLSTPFLQVNVNQLNERGLSSIVLDPNFSSNQYVYIYYTTSSSPIHNRLSRFTANGDVAIPGSEHIIMDFEPLVNSIHNGGGMAFGSDGKLFLATGNDNVNSYSQDLNNSKGKVLRINTDGSVPSGNPFTGSESAKRIWAYGLRNPWTIDIQAGTGKIFVNEVGEGSWEEINNATVGGRNFGWPGSEGATSNPAYTAPVYTYPHGSPGLSSGCAITGGVFFNPASTNYPSSYIGKYFFIDYCNHWINYLDLSSGVQKQNFASNLAGALNYIIDGADGNLYYFSISQNALYKIIYSNNNAPVITSQPASATVSAGQNVTFSVSASGATPMTFQWRKNGAAISGATSSSYTITNVQASHAGQYSAVVTNSYGNATSSNAVLTVTAYNAKPNGSILTPANASIYRGGDIINFSGNGTDAEDGTLPASAFNWYVEFHHDSHVHPGPFIPTGVKTGSFNISTTGEMSANVYFQLFLVVTDSDGSTDTSSVRINPKTCTLTLASQSSGLKLLLDGQPHTTPYSVLAVSGMQRTLGATSPQTMGDSTYTFSHWSQGGLAAQNIIVTDANQTFKAYYIASGGSTAGCSATGKITRDYWSNVYGTSVNDVPVNTAPTSTSLLTIFEGPINAGDHYGSRIRGYICPPATGNYIFWIASDNASELWLSTNSSPGSKVKIASVPSYTLSRQWTKYPSQKSVAIYLTAGTKYYIESIHREGDQGDHIAVGWQLPNGTMERPIPGSRLSPYTTSGGSTPVVSITSPSNNTTYSNPSNITFNANATSSGGSITKVEFFNGSSLIGQDYTAPYSYTWMNVSTGTYTITAKATNNTGQVGTSSPITVVVQGCGTPIITPLGTTTMCSGSVTLKTATLSGGSYQWKKDGVDISGATAASYTASSSGEYQVKVIQGSCISWSAPTWVKIISGLRATITVGGPLQFCPGGNVKLYGNTCAGFSYQWIRNGVDIAGATVATYTATTSGTYQLRVTQSGVHAWSSLVTVDVTCREGEEESDEELNEDPLLSEIKIEEPEGGFQMKVYPNPNNGLFTIGFNMPAAADAKIKIRIINLLGQEVYTKELIAKDEYIKETVELDPSLPTGIYTLQVMIGTKVENTSVVLSR
ncbi:MAG TPA: PQQ-dependent sugar dehydrogenase [Bacteroidia bacterium]|jgi:glucose/arabinose dehydrogenase